MHTSLNKLQNIATSCTVTTHKYASLTSENILSMDTIVSLKGIDGGRGDLVVKSPLPSLLQTCLCPCHYMLWAKKLIFLTYS